MIALLVVDLPDDTLSGWNVEHLSINKYNTDEQSLSFGGLISGVDYYENEIQLIKLPEKQELMTMEKYCWNYDKKTKSQKGRLCYNLDKENSYIEGRNSVIEELEKQIYYEQ